MEITNVAAYRAMQQEHLTLPSGAVFVIRKVQAWDFLALGELPVPTSSRSPGEELASMTNPTTQHLKRYTDRAIVKGTVQPQLTDTYDDGGEPVQQPDRLHVMELAASDYAALSQAIMRWSGLAEEDAKAIDAFRGDALSPVGQSAGGAL